MERSKKDMIVCIKGAGEMATAVAWRLYMANIRKIFMLECPRPLAVRRKVSFCEAVYDDFHEVENVKAVLCHDAEGVERCWQDENVAVVVDPAWRILGSMKADVVVDAILAKKNLGTNLSEAILVVGLGPGFTAGQDVHVVVETNRGHDLGRIIMSGSAEPNTGIPGSIEGFTEERVLRAPLDGQFDPAKKIGEKVATGDMVGDVDNVAVPAGVDGVLRGLIRPGSDVRKGFKIGDIDPRGAKDYCFTISDKARAISGSVLEAVLRVFPPGDG
jgi:xanthine dehydrogenase accessory factor